MDTLTKLKPNCSALFPEHALTSNAAREAACISRGAVSEELLVQYGVLAQDGGGFTSKLSTAKKNPHHS